MDLGTRRYETFAELYEYCIRVASAVGLICLNIFGARDPGARQYAIDLGVALQLTNILRDIPGDMAQGRLYVPLEDLRAHGCTEADLLAESGRRRTGRALGSGAGAAPSPGGAGARLLPAGRAGAAAPRSAQPGGRRDHGRDLSRAARPDRAERLRRVLARGPDSAAPARGHRRGHLGADRRSSRDLTVRRHRDRRRLRRSERGLRADAAAARRCWCSTRGRSSAGARPRFATARPASWSTTASTCCSGAIGRRWRSSRRSAPRIGCARSRRWSSCASTGSDAAPCCAARRCRRPLHLLAGVFAWTADSRGASGWERCGWRCRCCAPGVSFACGADRSRSIPGTSPSRSGSIITDRGATLQEWLWHPLAVAALNQQPADAAADAFVRILAEMFAPDPAAAAVVLPIRPLHEMYAEPARALITARGGEVRTSALARVRVRAGRVEAVEVRGELMSAPAVIAAVPWFGLRTLFGTDPPPRARRRSSRPPRDGADADRHRQPVVRPAGDDRGLRRPARPHDAVGVRQADRVRRIGLAPVARHQRRHRRSSATPTRRWPIWRRARSRPRCRARAASGRSARPWSARSRRRSRSRPGQPPRPGTRTPIEGLFLAGDWTDTGLPATIEGAVVSGNRRRRRSISA